MNENKQIEELQARIAALERQIDTVVASSQGAINHLRDCQIDIFSEISTGLYGGSKVWPWTSNADQACTIRKE